MATAKTAKVPLEVNQPLTGTVKYISYYPEKESTRRPGQVDAASWGLTGTWTWVDAEEMKQQAEGRVYITEYHLTNSPLQLGLAIADGQWDDGNPKYKWTYNQPVRVSMRKETGGKRLQVSITRLTELPTPAAGAVPTPPVASTGRATPTAKPSGSSVAPVAVPPDAEGWAALKRQYKEAVATAYEAFEEFENAPDDSAMVAAIATIFIEANKRGLTVPAPHVPPTAEQKAAAVRDAFDKYAEKPEALDDDEDSEPPF